MSELRDRIAAAIYKAASQWDSHPWESLAEHIQAAYRGQADAVIAELGLRKEGTDPEQIIGHGYPPMYRYVTDWQTAD